MKRILLVTAFSALLACFALLAWNCTLVNEKRRLSANQAALLADVERWRTEAGLSAASVERLELTGAELRKANGELADKVEELGIKLRRVQSASSSATETKVEVKTVVRDSLVVRDSVIVRVKDFEWGDPWTDIRGTIDQDSIGLSVRSRDTLTQVVHRVPRRFLFFRWGTRAVRQTVTAANPHTELTYTEYVELRR